MFFINGRYVGRRLTGVERYAHEVVKRFRATPEVITPSEPLKGLSGHLWEQAVLPLKLRGHLLWSPCNTGPLAAKDQIITLHDVIALDRPEWFNPRFVRLYSELLPRLTARVRHILTGSHYSKERFIERFAIKAEKITVTPYGVSEEFSPRSEEDIQSVREIYKIPHKRYLLMLASREPRKNHNGVLKAWNELMAKRDDVSLVIAGGQGESGNFRAVGTDPNARDVIYTNYIPGEHLPALYTGASGFLFPSLYEGFGLPVLEALACGTPVITSRTTSLLELQGGRMIMVDPACAEEITDAMMDLLDDPLPRDIVSKCCEGHARQFSWDKTAAQTEEILLRYSS